MRSRCLVCCRAFPKATPPWFCSDASFAFDFLHVNLSNTTATGCWRRCAGEGWAPCSNINGVHNKHQRDRPVAGHSPPPLGTCRNTSWWSNCWVRLDSQLGNEQRRKSWWFLIWEGKKKIRSAAKDKPSKWQRNMEMKWAVKYQWFALWASWMK